MSDLSSALAVIGVVGQIDGYDVIRRDSVIDIARREALAAAPAQLDAPLSKINRAQLEEWAVSGELVELAWGTLTEQEAEIIKLQREIAGLRQEYAQLRILLDNRPAHNSDLAWAYMMWSQQVYQTMHEHTKAALAGTAPVSQEYAELPEPFIAVQDGPWGGHAEVIRSAIGEEGVLSCFTTDHMRAFADATHALRTGSNP